MSLHQFRIFNRTFNLTEYSPQFSLNVLYTLPIGLLIHIILLNQ